MKHQQEYTEWRKQKVRYIPDGRSAPQSYNIDEDSLRAYEKYVLAQFKYSDQVQVEKERKAAIDSLIPGTLPYYHLYFLDLIKRKRKLEDFNADETELWQKFDQTYGQSQEFYEIETQLLLLNRIQDNLPQDISETTPPKDIQEIIDVVQYINENYLGNLGNCYWSLPEYMLENQDQSSHSENEEGPSKSLSQKRYDYTCAFPSRDKRLKTVSDYLKNLSDRQAIDVSMVSGFQEDIDWALVKDASKVFSYAENLIYQSAPHQDSQRWSELRFCEIRNESFMKMICQHFKEFYSKKDKELDNKKQAKLRPNQAFFQGFTLDQLDSFASHLHKMGYKVVEREKEYVQAYFSKVFHEQLSADYQESLTNDQKLQNLNMLYLYTKDKKLPKSLKQSLLHEMLTLTIILDKYDENLFKEYIQFPLERNVYLRKEKVINYNNLGERKLRHWQTCLSNVQGHTQERYFGSSSNWYNTDNEQDVIPKYLEHLCHFKYQGSLDAYSEDFSDDYRKLIETKVRVYLSDKGLLELGNDISPSEFKRIKEQVMLSFKETNRDKFSVEEGVSLQLKIKNVPELVIKVFEFNTETYYKKTLQPFDTSINLHGMVPSIQRVVNMSDIPQNKIVSREFVFDELKNKIGLFIIEFQGNGKLSRAVIKKGMLSLIHKSTTAGQLAYIIDADKKICKSPSTGVWINNKFYPCNVEKNGQIFIPYSTTQEVTKIIMIHDGFAQLGEFQMKTEEYDFNAFIHLASESVLAGQEAKVIIRPQLTVNGRKASVKLLKNVKVHLGIDDFIKGTSTKNTIENVKFVDDEETVVSFQVPPNMRWLNVRVECQILNTTKKQLTDLNPTTKQFMIKEHSTQMNINELYLRQEGEEYFIYCLGRNGEPAANKQISVSLKHLDFENGEQTQHLVSDKNGRIELGKLERVHMVRTQADFVGSESWMIGGYKEDRWTIAQDIHMVEGECLELPVNYVSNEPLKKHMASLLQYRESSYLYDLFDKIRIVPSPSGTYGVLRLEGLEVGEYKLKLNLSSQSQERIDLTVHKGSYWEGNFILKKNNIFESAGKKQNIRIEQVSATAIENQVELKVQLNNYAQQTRVHVIATQFLPNYSHSLFDLLESAAQEKISITNFPFARWKNLFESETIIGDELRYVLDRKHRQNQLGNTLDRPSLLMKRNYVRDTTNQEEVLTKGTQFAHRDLKSKEVAPEASLKKHSVKMMAKKRMVGKSFESSARYDNNAFSYETKDNFIKDYQNFLSQAPIQLLNLQPNEEGQVTVKLSELQNYTQLQILAVDRDSVVQRQICVNKLVSQIQNQNIPKRDLTVNKKVNDSQDKGLIDLRRAHGLQEGEQVYIEDINSSQVQIIDTIDKMVKIVEIISNLGINTSVSRIPNEEKIIQMVQSVLLKWHGFSHTQKLSQFSKFTCHELNFFLFKKDREFFDRIVKEFVGNKLEKTFIDWYLLAMSSEPNSAQGKRFSELLAEMVEDLGVRRDLNALELCLLVEVCLKRGTERQKQKALSLANLLVEEMNDFEKKHVYFKDGNIRSRLFDIVLSTTDLDAVKNIQMDSDQSLQDEDEYGGVGGGFRGGFGEQECYQECESYAMDCFESIAPSYQQPQLFGAATNFSVMNSMPMAQQIMPQTQQIMSFSNVMPASASNVQLRSMAMNSIPQQANRNRMSRRAEQKCDLFMEDDCDSVGYLETRVQHLNEVGFQELEKTAEYMETHYYKRKSPSSDPEFYNLNRFVKDYLIHLTSPNSNNPFLSDSFIDIPTRYLVFAMALIDFRFQSQQQEGQQWMHKYKSDKKRGIYITAACNAVIFKKEIKEGECQLKNDIMITHRYQQWVQNVGFKDSETNEMVINTPYQCEIIMTNISSQSKSISLLFQIPNGSLPLMVTKAIDSKQFNLQPFTTVKQTLQFYFPNDGKFDHAPSNITVDGIVTAKSSLNSLEVGRKRIITKIESFRDLMMTIQGEEAKRQKILELLRTRDGILFYDEKFDFSLTNIFNLTSNNHNFFLEVLEILSQKMFFEHSFMEQSLKHFSVILKDNKLAQKRHFFMGVVKSFLEKQTMESKLRSYIFKPISSLLMTVKPHKIFDYNHHHLEYFPMINQRVFSIGQSQQEEGTVNSNKKILNNEFRQTYSRFIYLSIHQELDPANKYSLDLSQKMKLQLAYYLQLQDRIDQAIRIFGSVNLGQLQEEGNDLTSQIVYDYMNAYFEFFTDQGETGQLRFPKSREVVKKYENIQIEHFKNMFRKLKEQLDEIDMVESEERKEMQIDKDEDITEEEKRQAMERTKKKEPIIHDIKMEKDSGELKIELQNIKQIYAKYYIIDAEILFSRSPFVKDEAKQFSFVKPFISLLKEASDQRLIIIPMPEELRGKNVVIEVGSDETQKFVTFYSSLLKVQLAENFGELRVFNKQTLMPLPRVYVKVFCKKESGEEVFYRDGFTDIRGKFEYATSSSKSVKDVKKFAILVSDDEGGLGQTIIEADPPKK